MESWEVDSPIEVLNPPRSESARATKTWESIKPIFPKTQLLQIQRQNLNPSLSSATGRELRKGSEIDCLRQQEREEEKWGKESLFQFSVDWNGKTREGEKNLFSGVINLKPRELQFNNQFNWMQFSCTKKKKKNQGRNILIQNIFVTFIKHKLLF